MLWRRLALLESLTFAHTSRVLVPHEQAKHGVQDYIALARKLNLVLVALAKDDALRLQRCQFSDRLLERVELYYLINRGSIFYPSTKDNDKAVSRPFDILDEGRTLQLQALPPQNWRSLPGTVQTRILDIGTATPSGIRFDFDAGKAHSISRDMMILNRFLSYA